MRSVRQIDAPNGSANPDIHLLHLELQLSDKRIEFCAKNLVMHVFLIFRLIISNAIIYLLSKLSTQYLNAPLVLKNIDMEDLNRFSMLNDLDSMCLLYSSPSQQRERAVGFPVSPLPPVLHSLHRGDLAVQGAKRPAGSGAARDGGGNRVPNSRGNAGRDPIRHHVASERSRGLTVCDL